MSVALQRGAWGLADHAVVDVREGRTSVVRWWHNIPEIEGGVLDNTVVYMLSNTRSAWHSGARQHDAAARRGMLGLLPAGLEGRWSFRQPIECLHLYLPPSLIEEVALEAGHPRRAELDLKLILDDHFIASLMLEISEAMSGDERSGAYLDSLGVAIAHRLIRTHSDLAHGRSADFAKGGLAAWQVRRALEYLNAGIGRDVRLDELAAVVGLSSFHFARMFKRSVGWPPHAELRRLRSERARELLARTELSVTEIAVQVGYGTPQAFARMFRSETGASPSAYRRARQS